MTRPAITVWTSYQPSIPTAFTQLPFNVLRANIYANSIAAIQATAMLAVPNCVPGWNYTNSVTRSLSSPGTLAHPTQKFWFSGTDNQRKWVKAEITWTGSNATKIAFYYSTDNEASYVPLADADGNYVLTSVFTGADLQTSTWGHTP